MPQPETVAETLAEGAALLRTHGHIKGGIGDKERGFCALGAVIEATGAKPSYLYAPPGLFEGAKDYLRLALPSGWSVFGIPGYNNHPTTSAEDVQLWFKRAEELAREAEEHYAAAG